MKIFTNARWKNIRSGRKLKVEPIIRKPWTTLFSPGVAAPCLAIEKIPSGICLHDEGNRRRHFRRLRRVRSRGHRPGCGYARHGGKCCLFRRFGVSAIPLVIAERIRKTGGNSRAIAPSFAASTWRTSALARRNRRALIVDCRSLYF